MLYRFNFVNLSKGTGVFKLKTIARRGNRSKAMARKALSEREAGKAVFKLLKPNHVLFEFHEADHPAPRQ
jgi:hypothetical protein